MRYGRHTKTAVSIAAVLALVLAACDNGADTGDEGTNGDDDAAAADDDATAEGAVDAGWCEGVSIAAFPGGPPGTVFTNNVHNGFLAAEADLGPDVTYFFSEWSPELLISQMREAIAMSPDGIATYGFAGEEATGPLVEEAYDQGIIVTILNTPLPESQEKFAAVGMGYVGADLYDAGHSLASEAADRAELGEGDKAFVWGLRALPSRGERTIGAIEALEERGIEVVYQEIDDATNSDPQAGTSTFAGVMSANPDIDLVITDHGALTSTAETYMNTAGLGPGDVYFAGFDVSPATAQAIESGFLNLVIDQQPFLQGYIPILNICLTEVYGFAGLHIDSAGAFVDQDNIDVIAPLAEQEIR